MTQAALPEPSAQEQRPNRRRHPRYLCDGNAEVYLPNGGLLFRGKILDLSVSGCFIEVPAMALERGTSVEVSFSTRQLPFRVAGHIAVLHRNRGAGIAFQEMIPRRARQIADLVSELKLVADVRKPQR